MINCSPRKLFLIDGIGATVSAFMLGIILVNFDSIFLMPKKILYLLAIIPCFFAIYSLFGYFKTPKNWQLFLKIIAVANFLYCILTISLLLYLYEQLSFYDIIYFTLELIIIGVLIFFELKTVK